MKIILLLCFLALPALAQLGPTNPPPRVQLAWDASPDPSVVAYRVYFGSASRAYTNLTQVNFSNTVVLTNVLRGTTYFFAVTCLSSNGLESPFSNEVSYSVPVIPAPTTLRLTFSEPESKTGPPVLIGQGEAYQLYTAERSIDLLCWIGFGAVQADGSGRFSVTDPEPFIQAAFYRTVIYF